MEPSGLAPPVRAAIKNVSTRPDLFPAHINFFNDHVLWIKMSPRWYDESVFLDAVRAKGLYHVESDVQFLRVACDRTERRSSAFIFHTAFCGSTLMSQTLAGAYRNLPLREPDALGNLMYLLRSKTETDQSKSEWLDRILRILSRRYDDDAPAVIKANDYANGLLLDVLRARPDAPVLFMYTPLAEFVAGCLKTDNRRTWIRDRYSIVMASGSDLLPLDSPQLSDDAHAEMAAVYWSYNIATYLRARREFSTTLRGLEFNHMLAAPAATVAAAASFFGLNPQPGARLADVIQSQFGVYSKSAEFRYSPQQREDEIKRLTGKFSDEIAAAEKFARMLLAELYPAARLPGEID